MAKVWENNRKIAILFMYILFVVVVDVMKNYRESKISTRERGNSSIK